MARRRPPRPRQSKLWAAEKDLCRSDLRLRQGSMGPGPWRYLATTTSTTMTIREFPTIGVPYFGVLIIRILLFRVLYLGPLFSETLILLLRVLVLALVLVIEAAAGAGADPSRVCCTMIAAGVAVSQGTERGCVESRRKLHSGGLPLAAEKRYWCRHEVGFALGYWWVHSRLFGNVVARMLGFDTSGMICVSCSP